MSRITLSRYDNEDNDPHVVVGWDNMLQTFFWQEFHPEDGPVRDVRLGEVDWDGDPVIGFAGYMPRELPDMESFIRSIPDDVKILMNEVMLGVLDCARDMDPNWVVDVSRPHGWRPMVKVVGQSTWSGNGLVFATPDEAKASVESLMNRWMMTTEGCVMPVNEPANYRFAFDTKREVSI